MTKVGLLSDTHGYWDESTCNILRAVTKYGMPVTSVRWKWHRSWQAFRPFRGRCYWANY